MAELLLGGSKWIGLAIFVVASLTDLADGKIARKYNLVTNFGKFADPLADKLLVTSAMLIFVEWGQLPSWLVMVVIAREFAVSGLRMIAASKGTVMAAGWSGKIKTASTMIAIVLMLTPLGEIDMVNTVCGIVILVTTVYSGVEYFVKNGKVLKDE
jgi:CDP-diacylglycerol--glycerol-3-phosphate 3-phosphatidyltransferase